MQSLEESADSKVVSVTVSTLLCVHFLHLISVILNRTHQFFGRATEVHVDVYCSHRAQSFG